MILNESLTVALSIAGFVIIMTCVFIFIYNAFLKTEWRRKALLKTGECAQAIIIPGTLSQSASNKNYYWMSFPVKVSPKGQSPFESKAYHKLLHFETHLYMPGTMLNIRFDPLETSMVAVDSRGGVDPQEVAQMIGGAGGAAAQDIVNIAQNIKVSKPEDIMNIVSNLTKNVPAQNINASNPEDIMNLVSNLTNNIPAENIHVVSGGNPSNRLEKIKDLYEKGLITEEEYKQKKAEILSQI